MGIFGRVALVAGVVLWVTNPQPRKKTAWSAGIRVPGDPLPSDAASVKDIGFISIARYAAEHDHCIATIQGDTGTKAPFPPSLCARTATRHGWLSVLSPPERTHPQHRAKPPAVLPATQLF